MPNMIFRSLWTRLSLAASGVTGGVIFTFGDGHKWRSTPSLHWLAQAPIPLQFWGIALIVYGLLLLPDQTRAAGYVLGGVLFSIFFVSLFVTVFGPGPKNIVAVIVAFDAVVFHVYCLRVAYMMRLNK